MLREDVPHLMFIGLRETLQTRIDLLAGEMHLGLLGRSFELRRVGQVF